MIENANLVRLTPTHLIKPFDCGHSDLNDFILNDAKKYHEKLLAVTYLLENEKETIAFFSLLNDKISLLDVESGNRWKRLFKEKMPLGKRFNSYPAMKIGRLGVSLNYKGQGIGTMILDYLKEWFISNNRTGCRYITVDAYSVSLGFYQRNQFDFLTNKDQNDETRLMYYDLYLLK